MHYEGFAARQGPDERSVLAEAMNDGHWEDVRRIFLDVLSQHPRNLRDFLDDACGTNASLQADVESLLVHHAMAERDGFAHLPKAGPRQT